MSYFIIIRGPLGVGKSTIAKQLAQILNTEYIQIDSILEKHDLVKVEEDYLPIDFLKANEIILPQVRKELSKGKVVVFDGNFYFKEQIEHLIQNLSAPHYIFTLKAPLEVCLKRDKERANPHGQAAARAVYNLVSKFDYGTIIEVSNKTADEIVQEIISYLP